MTPEQKEGLEKIVNCHPDLLLYHIEHDTNYDAKLLKVVFELAKERANALLESGEQEARWKIEPEHANDFPSPAAKYPDLRAFHEGVGGVGPHAFTWKDKPHRLVYDLTRMVAELRDAATSATPSDKQEAVAKWIVAREAVVDTGTPRKELAYAVPPESRLWDSYSEASAAIKEMGLPIGWVAMELHRLIPDAAPPAQSAEQDRIDAERLVWLSRNLSADLLNSYTRHVLMRGGDGDLSDIRTFIDSAKGASK
jgi:hypothetical protein